jgi:hypothetical protein
MGYELRMHIHSEMPATKEDYLEEGFFHGVEIGRLDLCKIKHGPLWDAIQQSDTFGAFFADNGNDIVTKDCYEDKIRRVPGTVVKQALEEELEKEYYRRFSMALAMLNDILRGWPEEQIFCYFYGH